MLSFLSFSFAIITVFMSAFYLIITKKSDDKLLFLFLTVVLSNFTVVAYFFIQKIFLGDSVKHALISVSTITTENIPFYMIQSLFFVTTNGIYIYLIRKYPISKVILILQLTIAVSTLNYYFLGDATTIHTIIGIIILSIGALVSGFKKFHFPNIFKPFTELPLELYILGFINIFISGFRNVIMFLVTQKTTETEFIHRYIDKTSLIEHFPLAFYSALDYKVGVTFSTAITFTLYVMMAHKVSCKKIYVYMKKEYKLILLATGIHFIYIALYSHVYQTIENKTVLIALSKFSIPLTLLFAFLYLEEEISMPQKVGVSMIVFGGLLAIF